MGKLIHLEPARPIEPEEVKPYLPRVRWKWVALGAAFAFLFGAYYWITESRKIAAMKSVILRFQSQELRPVQNRYEQFWRKLENFVLDAESRRPSGFVDPQLSIEALQKSRGLYVRLSQDDARSKDDIRAHVGSAKTAANKEQTKVESFSRCMGLEPTELPQVYSEGAFLLENWKKQVDDTSSAMRLRVLDHQLSRAIREKLPSVSQHMQAQWFLLVLDRKAAPGSGTHPVDVWLWDLKKDALLLSMRTENEGAMRFVQYGASEARRKIPRIDPESSNAVAQDCLNAAEVLRQVTKTDASMGANPAK